MSASRAQRVTTVFYAFYRRYRRPPTTREVAELIGCRSSQTAHQHLLQAAKRGYLIHLPKRSPAFWPAKDATAQIVGLCREHIDNNSPEAELAKAILLLIEGET
jgi:SOS-response transcriptional repressor LexA